MPEPVGLIAGTICIATFAYKSTKSLVEFIDSLKDAPKLISDVKGDVKATQNIIQSIESMLQNRDADNISGDLHACLVSSQLPLKDCQSVSEDFEAKLRDWFNDSKWDRLKANFKETKIAKFRTRLKDTRDTLDLALNVCLIKFDGVRADQAKKFEADMDERMRTISGKLQGLEIGRQEILDAAEYLSEQNHQLSFQQGELARRLLSHERVLGVAQKLYTAGLSETARKTGSTVKLAKAVDEAKQVVMMVGEGFSGDVEIGEMLTQGKAKSVGVTDNPEFALKFLLG